MVISCAHWDAKIGDHIGKSCGEGVYHELQVIDDPTRHDTTPHDTTRHRTCLWNRLTVLLFPRLLSLLLLPFFLFWVAHLTPLPSRFVSQESVGNTLGKFLSGEEEDKEMRRLTHNEKWNPSDRQTSLLRVQSETELSRGKSAVIKCAREHAHVYLWTEEPEEEEKEEEAEEKEKKKEEKKKEDEEHMKEEDEEEEKEREAAKDKGLWSDPIPDVIAWSKSHPPSHPSSEALNSTAAEAEEEKAEEEEEEEEGKGIMAVTVGKGFSKCISEHLAHTCSQASDSFPSGPFPCEGAFRMSAFPLLRRLRAMPAVLATASNHACRVYHRALSHSHPSHSCGGGQPSIQTGQRARHTP
jgi:hypothetical protein